MKKRNKEYAKRSAVYKKKDDGFNIQKNSQLFDISMLENGLQSVFQNIGSQFEEFREISTSISDSNLSDIEKQEQLKKRLQDKFGNNINVQCSSNGTNKNIVIKQNNTICENYEECQDYSIDFKKDETSLFEISTIQRSGNVLKLCGKVIRGRFMFDDEVGLRLKSGDYPTQIIKIVRQGEDIDYANSASGVIVITIPNNSNIIIQPGDKLIKSQLG